MQHTYNGTPLTRFAKKLIKTKFYGKKIIEINEKCDHDGYDCDGPLSDLWKITIVTLENNKHIANTFECENWYDNIEPMY